jgi:hypothetical protein
MPSKSHGHSLGSRGNTKRSLTYNSWRSMRERCYLKSNIGYKNYGAKGITVCDSWKDSFECFLEDMGERPEGYVLSRKGDKGNYEPGNVTWKTLRENSSEKKHAVGSAVGVSKLTEAKVLEIRQLRKEGYGVRELGRMYGVNHKSISCVVNRKTWVYI